MDDAVRTAMAKWPNVPACYDWLALDARGVWRMNGDVVRHAGLADFLGRNYGHDEAGNWFSQNGPQRVFVALAVTPWILRLVAPERLATHTGLPIDAFSAAFLDEAGRLLLEFALDGERQIGLVCDKDLPTLLERARDASGAVASEADLLAVMAGQSRPLSLHWQEQSIPLASIQSDTLPQHYGFNPRPAP
jgi:hypothetical protein